MRFRSPLRDPWLTSVFAVVLLVGMPIVVVTGLLDRVAYGPAQGLPGDVGLLQLRALPRRVGLRRSVRRACGAQAGHDGARAALPLVAA